MRVNFWPRKMNDITFCMRDGTFFHVFQAHGFMVISSIFVVIKGWVFCRYGHQTYVEYRIYYDISILRVRPIQQSLSIQRVILKHHSCAYPAFQQGSQQGISSGFLIRVVNSTETNWYLKPFYPNRFSKYWKFKYSWVHKNWSKNCKFPSNF